jgi:flagellar hook-associated protein 2
MAEGILGLGSGQAATLNQDLIDKLKEADRTASVKPIEDDLESWDLEQEKFGEIKAKVLELLDVTKPFDLYVSGGVTAFDQKTANATGDSVIFDAADESALNTGTTTVTINTLAKRDVFQSDAVDSTALEADVDSGDLVISLAGADGLYTTTHTISTTGKTYEEIAQSINYISSLSASIEQVGDDSYRLVIKSTDSGLENELKITGTASQALGYTIDGTTEASGANVQKAQNLTALVNGISYDLSSNVITVDNGLKITAVDEGTSTISIEKDTTTIQTFMEDFINKYNELVTLVNDELYSAESNIEDKSTLRTMMDEIKGFMFGSYGTNNDLNVFNFGFEVDKNGYVSLDSGKFTDMVENNFSDLKNLFLGVAEAEGLGTQLKTYIDDLDSFEGLLTKYEDNMNSRKTSLEEEKEKAVEHLDSKYSMMAQQFAAYGAIITQFESQFSGLKMMIEQSTA